jgi:hypothetical protein
VTIVPVISKADASKEKFGAECLHPLAITSFASRRTKRKVVFIEFDSGKIQLFQFFGFLGCILIFRNNFFCSTLKILIFGAGEDQLDRSCEK